MQPFWRAMTFSLVFVRWWVFLIRDASTLILDGVRDRNGIDRSRRRSRTESRMHGLNIRSNIVYYHGNSKAMVTSKNVLEESGLSRALRKISAWAQRNQIDEQKRKVTY